MSEGSLKGLKLFGSSLHLTWGEFLDVRKPQRFCCTQGEQREFCKARGLPVASCRVRGAGLSLALFPAALALLLSMVESDWTAPPRHRLCWQLLSAPVLCRGKWTDGWRAAPWLCWSSGYRGGGSCLGAHSAEGRSLAGWQQRQGGLAQRKRSALQGIIWSCLNSSSHSISRFHFLSFPDHIPAAWRFSS